MRRFSASLRSNTPLLVVTRPRTTVSPLGAVEGNKVTLDDEIAKLRLVAEAAREVWG
jgi:hypothetical protein